MDFLLHFFDNSDSCLEHLVRAECCALRISVLVQACEEAVTAFTDGELGCAEEGGI